MICLVSVVWSFCHHRFLRHRQGYWFVGFWNIIAFYSIAPDIGFVWFFVIIAFYGIDGILVFVWFLEHYRFLQHSSGYWFCSVFVIIAFYSIDVGYWFFCLVF
jgi:hypothetical protein